MDIERALDRLDAAETDEEIRAIGEELLADDPESPYGKLAVWQTMEYEESMDNLDMLFEALDKIRSVVEAKTEPPVPGEDRDAQVYCTVLMNLGYSLLVEGKPEEALSIAREFANFDDEGCFPSRTLLYRVLLDLDMYGEILDELETDPIESVAGEHARVISMIETGADEGEIRDALIYAISLSPDTPFLILNIWEMPDAEEDVDDDMEDTLSYAAYLAEPWCSSDKRISVLSAPVFLFGYISGRLEDEKEEAALRDAYEAAGFLEEIEEAKNKIAEMTSGMADPEETDASALGYTGEILEKMFG